MNTSSSYAELRQAMYNAKFDGQFGPITPKQLKSVINNLSLSSELLDWYQVAAPLNVYIPWHGDELLLYSPLELVEYQEGYRWEVGHRGEIHPSWHAEWIVIGDTSGDPIVAHIDQEGTPISMAIHGIGKWELQRVASSLATFLKSLSVWVQIAGRYNKQITGEDGALLPNVVNELKVELSTMLTQEQVDNFLSFI